MHKTATIIQEKLIAAFAPSHLEVIDESEQHRGHGGWREGQETHFRIRITSGVFADKSRVAAHRLIYAALQTELQNGVHALAVEIKQP